MGSFSRLSTTIDYSSFSVTKEPGALPSDGVVLFAQIDPSAHPVIGEYRVEKMLDDAGAQANVYLAKHHGQQYALKLYRKGFIPAQEVQKVLASGECPSLAPVVASGHYQGDYWYEVFPYYSSGTIEDLITKNGSCAPSFIEKQLIPAIDEALFYLHSRNLVHADVKPQNIFVSEDQQRVLLGDFGVAGLIQQADGLVPFRGTLEYAPYALHSGNQVRIDSAYDYGALGLVLIKAYTGHSLLSGMTLEERDEALLSLQVPESIPLKARNLIQGLLRNDPRSRFGHDKCREFINEGQSGKTYASRRGRGRTTSAERESRQRTFEFGYFDSQMIIANSADSLLEACEKYWAGAKASLDTAKLEGFLKLVLDEEDFFSRNVAPYKSRPIDERVFRFCNGLRKVVRGDGDHTVVYKNETFPSIVHLLKHLDDTPDSELEDIIDGEAIPDYLRMYGYGASVADAAKEIIDLDRETSEKAQMLVAICDSDSHAIHLSGSLIESIDALLQAMIKLNPDEINDLATNPSLTPWLHRQKCDFVVDEMEAMHEW